MDLQQKTVFITGGAVRIGREIALAFASAGANVLIHYHTSAREAAQTVEEIRSYGVASQPFQADLQDAKAVEKLCDAALQSCNGIDILVNCASFLKPTPFPSKQYDDWDTITAVSIDAPYHLANRLTPAMLDKREGTIINILDLSIWQAWSNFTAHSVGKSGLLALTRQLALELSPDVRVNAVMPGYVLPPAHFSHEKIEAIAKQIPLKRWGKPQEVAKAVLFLARADYITGTVLPIDGGAHLLHRSLQ